MSNAAMTTVYAELARQFPGFSPEYKHGLSNHLPMALFALRQLGGDDAQLRSFYDVYAPRLSHGVGELSEPEAKLYLDARSANRDAIASTGSAALLKCQLNMLAGGIGAAAFHGMLRTFYGIEAEDSDEIAAGLAYWQLRYLPLAQERPDTGAMPLATWLERLCALPNHVTGEFNLIFERMQAFARQPHVQEALGGLDVDSLSLDDLSRTAAIEYARHEDFTVLHLLTSSHAMRVLMNDAEDPRALLHHYAIAFGVAYALAAKGGTTPALVYDTLPLDEIEARARASQNDHTLKLVYSCRALRAIDEELFLRAASAAVRDLPAAH